MERSLRAGVFVKHGGNAPLDVVAAHDDDDMGSAGYAAGLRQMEGVPVMKWIVFCYDADDVHMTF